MKLTSGHSPLSLSRLRDALHSNNDAESSRRAPQRPEVDHHGLSQRLEQLKHLELGKGRLSEEIRKEIAPHWSFYSATHQDGLMDQPYCEMRRKELRGLPGGQALADQYGIHFALRKLHPMDMPHQLRIENAADSKYLRDEPSHGFHAHCMKLFREQGGSAGAQVLFVNSRLGAEQIMHGLKLPPPVIAMHLNSPRLFKELQPGVHALDLTGLGPMQGNWAARFLPVFGARPSGYSVRNSKDTGASRQSTSVNNEALLNSLKSDSKDSPTLRLHGVPKEHATGPLSHTAADLIESLVKTLEPRIKGDLQQDVLLADGLKNLHHVASMLPALSHDSRLFNNAYSALMEELQLCLSASQPYTLKDFKRAAMPLSQPPSLPRDVMGESFLMTSGMGALSLGHQIAADLSGNDLVVNAKLPGNRETPCYYEVSQYRTIPNPPKSSDRMATLFATLNASMPGDGNNHAKHWNVDDVIAATRQNLQGRGLRDKPLTLLLDATVEKRDDMDKLVGAFSKELSKGKLRIVVCKSYQKYANLGSAKVMAGAVGLIGKEDKATLAAAERLLDSEADINWMQGNDAQLMVHLLKQHDHEMNLIDRASENARFCKDNFFSGEGRQMDALHDKHLPFIAVPIGFQANNHFSAQLGDVQYSNNYYNSENLPSALVRMRDGFGYNETSLGNIPMTPGMPTALRITVGQESQAELTERFYMPSLLMHTTGSDWNPKRAHDEVMKLISDARQDLPASLKNAPLSEQLRAIAAKEQPRSHNPEDLSTSPTLRRQENEQNGKPGFTLNKVASVMVHLEEMLRVGERFARARPGDIDREHFNSLVDALVDSGMPGISSASRALILQLQSSLCSVDMQSDDPARQQQALERLVHVATRMPELARNTNALMRLPDNVFIDAPDAVQDGVVDSLFRPLPGNTKEKMIELFINNEEIYKANACLRSLEDPGHYGSRHPTAVLVDGPAPKPVEQPAQSLQATLLREKLNQTRDARYGFDT
ncbi:hypothetical protein ACKC9G_17080 [Pokkaliibacter sp. CJK22405]|uniref:hypothetical protein n=1 Tax=Pokkaliibacter sp. CJK22405 TaxID=3384615 RepID=UPI003984C0EA